MKSLILRKSRSEATFRLDLYVIPTIGSVNFLISTGKSDLGRCTLYSIAMPGDSGVPYSVIAISRYKKLHNPPKLTAGLKHRKGRFSVDVLQTSHSQWSLWAMVTNFCGIVYNVIVVSQVYYDLRVPTLLACFREQLIWAFISCRFNLNCATYYC